MGVPKIKIVVSLGIAGGVVAVESPEIQYMA